MININMEEVREMIYKINKSKLMNIEFNLIDEKHFYYIEMNYNGYIGKISVEEFIDTYKFLDVLTDKIEVPDTKEEREIVENDNNQQISYHDLMDIPKKEKVTKKIPMSIYFEEDDIKILKAIAYIKNVTVNKLMMYITKAALDSTIENLPNYLDIDLLAKQYDIKSGKGRKKNTKKSTTIINNNCNTINIK